MAMIGNMSDLPMRHGPKLAVGGLVLVNLVLIGALMLKDPVPSAVPAESVPASSLSVTARSTPTPTGTATETTTSAATSVAPGPTSSDTPTSSPNPSPPKSQPTRKADSRPRLLAANSGRVAWRAKSTGCRGTAVVEVTTNGGRSWSKTRPGLTAIVRLKAYGDISVFAIGADDQCRPTYAWIRGPGQTWQRDRSEVENIWFRSPDNLDKVHAPSGRMSKPCGNGLVSLAGLGTFQAAALCADGRIRTDARGRSWKTIQTRSEARSLNADDDWFVAVGRRRDCRSMVVWRFDTSGYGLSGRGSCRTDIKVLKGPTAVSARYRLVWMWSGDQVVNY